MMEEVADGYNLTYDFNCTYFDDEGELQSCTLGLTDKTLNLPYTFWIEQVTSSNRITMSFTMNRLFFMLDSKFAINILSLHNNDLNLDEINLYSLDSLKTFQQMDQLGCNISDYSESLEFFRDY
jgi:hypothetical protein